MQRTSINLCKSIRWLGMSGYHFFLISRYLDILDNDFFWILGYHGYMDTWIHGYQFSLDTWILGYFGYQIFSLSIFWISYPSIRIFLDTFFNYQMRKKGNQIQVLRSRYLTFCLLYALHYKLRLVYLLPHFQSTFFCF